MMTYLKGLLIACAVCIGTLTLPAVAEPESSAETEQVTQQVSLETVNINSANAEELALVLRGVGIKRAQAIIEYREINGPFSDAAQLLEVKGIGEATIENNRDKIRL